MKSKAYGFYLHDSGAIEDIALLIPKLGLFVAPDPDPLNAECGTINIFISDVQSAVATYCLWVRKAMSEVGEERCTEDFEDKIEDNLHYKRANKLIEKGLVIMISSSWVRNDIKGEDFNKLGRFGIKWKHGDHNDIMFWREI